MFSQHNFKNGTTISPFTTVWRKWILITQEKCFANIYHYLLIFTSFFVILTLLQTFPMKMFKKWCQKVKCIPAFLFNFEWNWVNGQGKTLNMLNRRRKTVNNNIIKFKSEKTVSGWTKRTLEDHTWNSESCKLQSSIFLAPKIFIHNNQITMYPESIDM